jgi:hypothetical protein
MFSTTSIAALTLRGDFVGHALAYRPLSDRLQSSQKAVQAPAVTGWTGQFAGFTGRVVVVQRESATGCIVMVFI